MRLVMILKMTLFLLLVSFYPSLAANILPESFEFNYELAYSSNSNGNNNPLLYSFSYFEPFFLDRNDIAFKYGVNYQEGYFDVKKWDFLDYNLGFGVNYFFSTSKKNRAEYFQSYTGQEGFYDGSYSGFGLYTEYLLNENSLLRIAYHSKNNRFSANGKTPTSYSMPLNNHIQSWELEYKSQSETLDESVGYFKNDILLGYGFSDKADHYFDAGIKQFDKILFIDAKTEYIAKNLSLFGALKYSTDSDLLIGNSPLRLQDEDKLYGFKENSINYRLGLLGGIKYNLANFINNGLNVYIYDALLYCDNPNQYYRLSDLYNGIGLGCMIPVEIPIFGKYNIRLDYMLAQKGWNEVINTQLTVNIFTSVTW